MMCDKFCKQPMLIILLSVFYISASQVLAKNMKPFQEKTAWNATEEATNRLDKLIETVKQTGRVENVDKAVATIETAGDFMEIIDLLDRLDVLQEHRKDKTLPEPEKALSSSQKLDWAILTRQIRGQIYLSVDKVKAHPAAKAFPGAVDVKAKRVKKAVEIWTDRPGWRNKHNYANWHWGVKDWQSTGLYAAPGEILTVTVAKAATDAGLSVRIGAHSDLLWKRDEWRRAPEICRSFHIKDTVTKAANAFGGPIYIETPDDCTLGKFNVTIDGAVEMPWYIAGKTTSDEWKEIRDNPAPWAELQTAKIVLTLPSEHVEGIDDPAELMEFWDGVMDSCADLLGRDHDRQRAERFVTDAQISSGFMHAGYPLMAPLEMASLLVDKAKIMRNEPHVGGLFHEIGHRHQNHLWTFRGTDGVTVSLFTFYVFEKMCGLGPKDNVHMGGVSPAAREGRLRRYLEGGKNFDDWQENSALAVCMYSMMQEEFGWEPFTKVFKEYRAADESELPKNDDDKRDQWMVRFSRMVGKNLGPFFDAWGVPTSQEAKKSISSLPTWMPTDFAKVKASKKTVNIAAMSGEDFNRLIREFYEEWYTSIGGEFKVTQASSDGGFQAVGFGPNRGGKHLIQAKRYTNTFSVADVRNLYSTVVNEGAIRGTLITTSDYDNDSYEFAKGKPLALINGSKLLRSLERRGHFYRIDIAEANKFQKNSDDLDSDPNNAMFPAIPPHQLGQVEERRSAINSIRDSLEEIEFADITSDKLSSWIAAEKLFAGTNEQLLAIWELIGTQELDQAVTLFAEIQPSIKNADSDLSFSLQGLVQYLSRMCYARGKDRLLDKDQGYIDRAFDYEAALSIDPNYVSALKDLAWLQTTCPVKKVRNFTKAIELATHACELTDYKNHECISILAASYSETGNVNAAIKWQKTAIASLPDDYPIALRANYEARCGAYQSHKPYHKGSLWSLSDGELIAHWKFDEVTKGMVLDSTGKGLNGRLIGNAHIVSDVDRGSVLKLPDQGNFVDCVWNPAFDITGAITIAAWVKVTKLDGRWKEIVGMNNCGLGLRGKDLNHVILSYWYGDDVWIKAELDVDNHWHLIVGLYDGQECVLYIDGKLCASERFYKSIAMDTGRLHIGRTLDKTDEGWKDALIDDIRIYSYALSTEEVKMLYEGKEPPRAKGSD